MREDMAMYERGTGDVCDMYRRLVIAVIDNWDGQCTADLVQSIYEATGEEQPARGATGMSERKWWLSKSIDPAERDAKLIQHLRTTNAALLAACEMYLSGKDLLTATIAINEAVALAKGEREGE